VTTNVGSHQSGRLVRPYAITGGRVGNELSPMALEALVTATPGGAQMIDHLAYERAEIVRLTESPTAVVEIAALLEVPIGVVRVLVDDLVEIGAVNVAGPTVDSFDSDGEDYPDLLQRLLDGIKAL